MKSKVTLIISMVLVVALLIGAGTYAFFSASVANANNKFTSGKINLTGFRDDMPLAGPMFYTEDDMSKGLYGTGFWQPGDSKTRGYFVQNNGLDVRLKKVTVETDGIMSQDNETALREFNEHGNIIISVIKRGDRVHQENDNSGNQVDGVLQTEYAKIMKDLEKRIQTKLADVLTKSGCNDPLKTQAENKALYLAALAETKEHILNTNFNAASDGSLPYWVQEVYQGSFGDFYANGQELPKVEQFTLNKNEARYFGYTIALDNPATADNVLQGKDLKLKFVQEWIQKNR